MKNLTIKKDLVLSFLFVASFILVANEIITPIGTLRGIVISSFLYFLMFFKDRLAPKEMLRFVIILFIYSIVAYFYTGFLSIKTFSQIIFFSISIFFMYMLFKRLGCTKIYNLYIKLALFVSIAIYIQTLGYYANIPFLYDYSYIINTHTVIIGQDNFRANSIFPEPSTITYINTLAVVMSFYSLIIKKRVGLFYIKPVISIIIISSYLMTYSSLGYVVILITIISLIRFNIKTISSILILVIGMYFFLITNSSFMYRIDGVMSLFSEESLSVDKMNLSTWALFSNFIIAWNNFKEYFPLGVGIANHPLAYDKFSYLLGFVKNIDNWDTNKQNAGGLFFRIMSEFGMFGLTALLYFIKKSKIKNQNNQGFYYLSNGFLIGIIIILLRHGAYISTMTIFYFVGYYFISKNYLNELIAQKKLNV